MKSFLPLLTGVALVAFQGQTVAQSGESQDIRSLRRELEATRRELAELKEMIRSMQGVRHVAPPQVREVPTPVTPPRRIRAIQAPHPAQGGVFVPGHPIPLDATMEKHLRESLGKHFAGEELERILKSVRDHMPKPTQGQGFHWIGEGGTGVFHLEQVDGDKKEEGTKKRRAIAIIGGPDQHAPEMHEIELELEGAIDLPEHIEKLLEEHGVHEHGAEEHGEKHEVHVFGTEGGGWHVIRSQGDESKTPHRVDVQVIEPNGIRIVRPKAKAEKKVDVRVEKVGNDDVKGQIKIHIVGPDGEQQERVIELGDPKTKGGETRRIRIGTPPKAGAKPPQHVFRIEVDDESGEAKIEEGLEGLFFGDLGLQIEDMDLKLEGLELKPEQLEKLGEGLKLHIEPKIQKLHERMQIELEPMIEKIEAIEGPIILELDGKGLEGNLKGVIEGLKIEGLPKLEGLRSKIRSIRELKEKEKAEEKGATIYV